MVCDVGPLDRGTGQDQAKHRPRARRPQQAGRDAEQKRGHNRIAMRLRAVVDRLRQPRAESDQRPHHAVSEPVKDERQSKQREQRQCNSAAVLIGLHRPSAGDGRQRGDRGKRHRHADEHRQAAPHEGAVGAREHERQHRQDAGADDRQHPAQIGEQEQDHRKSAVRPW